jgi:putative glutathione S-transferase
LYSEVRSLLTDTSTQEAYEKNVTTLFKSLDRAEEHLANNPGPYYHGDRVTEADIRLYTVINNIPQRHLPDSDKTQTIVRFDAVYVQHFKCNLRDIRSGYPALHKYVDICYCFLHLTHRTDVLFRWVRNLYWNVDAFGSTTDFHHIKGHYTQSHKQINPFGITPVGPIPAILPLNEEVAAVKGKK